MKMLLAFTHQKVNYAKTWSAGRAHGHHSDLNFQIKSVKPAVTSVCMRSSTHKLMAENMKIVNQSAPCKYEWFRPMKQPCFQTSSALPPVTSAHLIKKIPNSSGTWFYPSQMTTTKVLMTDRNSKFCILTKNTKINKSNKFTSNMLVSGTHAWTSENLICDQYIISDRTWKREQQNPKCMKKHRTGMEHPIPSYF